MFPLGLIGLLGTRSVVRAGADRREDPGEGRDAVPRRYAALRLRRLARL